MASISGESWGRSAAGLGVGSFYGVFDGPVEGDLEAD